MAKTTQILQVFNSYLTMCELRAASWVNDIVLFLLNMS